MVTFTIAGLFIFVVACGVGFSAASADSSDDLVRVGAFGFDEATHKATQAVASNDAAPSADEESAVDQRALASSSPRDISAGLSMIGERGASGSRAAAQPDAKPAESGRDVMSRDEAGNELITTFATDCKLTLVDWSCGREAFISEWTDRINAYLSGTELDGYGAVFAEAAWENGVDPRWSPAISNTESTNGASCFLPYNAWGWGDSGFSDWETAIRAHVAGLSEVYGYSITVDAARTYCPPNYVHWYSNTIKQMALI